MRLSLKKFNPLYFIAAALLSLLSSAILQWSNVNDLTGEVNRIQSQLSRQTESIDASVKEIIQAPQIVDWSLVKDPVFLIDRDDIVAWSTNDFTPDLRLNAADTSFVLVKNNAGDFLYKRTNITDTRYLLSVIPLQRKYPITNQYLTASLNKQVFKDIQGRIETPFYEAGEIIELQGKPVFRFVFSSTRETFWSFLIFILSSFGILLLVMGVFLYLKILHLKSKYELVFLWLIVVFVTIRLVMIYVEYPSRWISVPVFDPQIFASSAYNPSIGDLLINSFGVLLICLYAFFYYPKFSLTKRLLSVRSEWSKYFLVCLLFASTYFSLVYPFLFVEITFHNSLILLDITESLSINGIRLVSWLSVVFGSVSAFLFIHILTKLSKRIISRRLHLLALNAIGAALFLSYFLIADRNYWITLFVGLVLISILISFKLANTISRIQFDSFIYLFVMLTALGLQYGLSIRLFTEERQLETNLKYATNYIIGRDILGEYLLQETNTRISNDAYIQSAFTNPFINRSLIRQKIRQVYLSTYFDRYELKLYLHATTGVPSDSLVNQIFTNYFKIPFQESFRTEYKDIYFIKPVGGQTNKRYVSLIPLYKSDLLTGYIVLDLLLKRLIPENVYPELLVDSRFSQYYENQGKSFALISGDKIVSTYGEFNYDQDFNFNLLKDERIFKNGVETPQALHFAVSEDTQQAVVISTSRYSFFNLLTNFSLFFVSGVLVVVLVLIVALINSVYSKGQLNYAARIQLIIFSLFSLPLMVAALTTLNRVSESAEEKLSTDYRKKTQQLSEGVTSLLMDYANGITSRGDFEGDISNLAKQSNVDLTIYSKHGKYLASSQPMIFENQLSSALLDAQIWKQLTMREEFSVIEIDGIGKLQFNNCYQTILNPESGDMIGILSVPFFNSEDSLEATKISVLSNFLTIFTIIFILFSVLSFYIVNWLTYPLQFITKALGKTTLTGENKTLKWNSQDEIGLMVNEYNKMVTNLEQSKIELARSQKESAWREIARQVAHEIKNPLTPMKLTLQQMEYQLLANNLDNEKVKKALKSILVQIEILNEIASSFGTFARMPAPIMQRVELVKLIRECVNLYTESDLGSVAFETKLSQLFVMGDEQLLSRIFSNLILNGLQSGRGKRVQVSVSLEVTDNYVLVAVKDNGAGIDAEMADKIFLPYFSTKKSGSGLGLAISKQGIEQSGGEIWFESKPGAGTTFFIKLSRID